MNKSTAREPRTPAEYERARAKQIEETKAQIGATLNIMLPALAFHLTAVQEQIFAAMQVQGFWAPDQDSTASKIALMHSELSEALEADRKSIEADDKIPEFSGLEAELADTVIRILDFAGARGLRLGEAIQAKMLYNLSRPFRHGKAY